MSDILQVVKEKSIELNVCEQGQQEERGRKRIGDKEGGHKERGVCEAGRAKEEVIRRPYTESNGGPHTYFNYFHMTRRKSRMAPPK